MDCYAKRGNSKELLSLFDDLKKDKSIRIPKTIFRIVLNGCSHSGLIDEALSIFDSIKSEFNNNEYIDPQCITILIDCLGRKGGNNYLAKAEHLYEIYMEQNDNIYCRYKLPALFSLLSSSRIHNDMICGKRIFNKINELI
eukprot:4562_1